mgnify:CR=1 FL=1
MVNTFLLVQFPAWGSALVFAAAGGLLTVLLTRRGLAACDLRDQGTSRYAGLAGAVLCGLLVWLMLDLRCQQTPVVRPSPAWMYWRVGSHALLVALMTAATATDLRDYLIPDNITLTGLLAGVLLATVSGDLQVQHLWIDWNAEVTGLRGAYFPEWIRVHPHWHGLAWSLTGAAAGAGGVWIVRGVASAVLGREAMGLGDVTLMGMIGSFLGWQPVVFVLLLAPLVGLLTGPLLSRAMVRLSSRAAEEGKDASPRPYVPFGPFLCLAAYLVMASWRWLWMFEVSFGRGGRNNDRLTTFSVRRLFGDWQALLVIGGAILVGLTVLLILRRLYAAIPVTRAVGGSGGTTEETERTE